MKLTYDILWLEDQFSELAPTVNRLQNFIESKGLIPNIEKRSSITQDEIYDLGDRLENNNPYDILIFDFDMGRDNPTGVDIAHTLRANIYTDMVFYSGKKPDEINKIVFDSNIQGVFVIHKPSFFDQISPLIADHIKKISSLNGARGMIMSEWSEIEIDLRNHLVDKLHSLDPDTRESHEQKIINRLTKQASGRLKSFNKDPDLYSLLMSSMQCDFSIIRRSLKALHNEGSIFDDDNHVHQMQDERNLLAHNKQELQEDGILTICDPKGREKNYNIEEFKALRKRLISLREKISEL